MPGAKRGGKHRGQLQVVRPERHARHLVNGIKERLPGSTTRLQPFANRRLNVPEVVPGLGQKVGLEALGRLFLSRGLPFLMLAMMPLNVADLLPASQRHESGDDDN